MRIYESKLIMETKNHIIRAQMKCNQLKCVTKSP